MLGRFYKPSFIRQQQHGERSKSQAHGLNHDPRILHLKHCRNPTQRQTLQKRIRGCRQPRPLTLKNGNHCHYESAQQTEHHQPVDCSWLTALENPVPDITRADQTQYQQDTGLIDRTRQGHALSAVGFVEGCIGLECIASEHRIT